MRKEELIETVHTRVNQGLNLFQGLSPVHHTHELHSNTDETTEAHKREDIQLIRDRHFSRNDKDNIHAKDKNFS